MKTEEASVDARITELEESLQSVYGQLRAMEYGLQIALSTHPDPKCLHECWTGSLPAIVDKHLPNDPTIHPLYHAALKRGLGAITLQIMATHHPKV